MGLYNLIVNQDYFGHRVQLFFNRKGAEHKTFGGGVVSLVVNVLMGSYVFILVKRMVNYEDDTIATSIKI
jgi:hypothetical protein